MEKQFSLEREVECGKHNNYDISNKYLSEQGNIYLCYMFMCMCSCICMCVV